MSEDDVLLKQCNACKNFLPATPEFFQRHKGGRYGLEAQCKPCVRKYNRDRYHSDPEYRERILTNNRAYCHRSPTRAEKMRASVKAYRSRPDGKAYIKAYMNEYRQRPEVQEHTRAYQKAYRQRPDVRERHLAYEKASRMQRRKPKQDRTFADCTCAACILPVDMARREHITALLSAHPDMTLTAIGKRVGCSHERVRQLKQRIQEKQDQAETKSASTPRRISWAELWQWSRTLLQWAEQHDYPRLRLGYKQGWIQQGHDGWSSYFRDISAKRLRYVADSIELYEQRHSFTERNVK